MMKDFVEEIEEERKGDEKRASEVNVGIVRGHRYKKSTVGIVFRNQTVSASAHLLICPARASEAGADHFFCFER